MLRTLFLNPPSFEGFDGGAGARYQARREIRSYWYPTWLAQPAALVPGNKLVDAPPADLTLGDVAPLARSHDLVVLHTSSPTFAGDVKVAEALKAENPAVMVGFVGPKVAVQPGRSLRASTAIDFVAREEFDFTIAEVAEGRPLASVAGISFKDPNGRVIRNPDRELLTDMDRLPFVTPVYKRDLRPEDYYIGYLLHPYVSLYTGRGCRSRCTFCRWPQTVGGHRYRTRSVDNVLAEAVLVRELFPQVKELFFDDDTFTGDRARAEAIARGLGKLGLTWSCNAKANVPWDTLMVLKDNPHTIQVSVAAPYPGTELHRQAVANGWLPEDDDGAALVSEHGTQLAALSYPHLGHTEMLESVDAFYKRFYFQAGKIAEMSAELVRSPGMTWPASPSPASSSSTTSPSSKPRTATRSPGSSSTATFASSITWKPAATCCSATRRCSAAGGASG